MKRVSTPPAGRTTAHTFVFVNLLILFIHITSVSIAANLTSTGLSTSWNASLAWTGGGVGATPSAGDNITISNGHTIIINTSTASMGTITVNGILEFQAGTARTLTCTSVSVASTGTFRTSTSGTVTGHVLSVSGGIANGGTLDFYTNSGSADADIIFTGSTNVLFSGAGATTDIKSITVNKGSSATPTVELTVSNFTVRGVNTDVAGFLTLTNGTFKISGAFTMTNRVFTSAGYTIGSTTGFELNNANFTVPGQSGSVTWNGTLTVSNGSMTIGTASDHNLYYYGSTASYNVSGGNLYISSCIEPYYDASNYTYSLDYTQSGGTITLNTKGNTIAGSNGKGFPSFWLTQSSSFTISGGTIVLRGENSIWDYDFDCSATTRSISGGTLQIGDALSGSAKRYGITGYFPNLLVTNTSGNHSVEFYKISTSPYPYVYYTTVLQNNTTLDANANSLGATFAGDITIGTGATFDAGNVTHIVKSNWINNGTFTYRSSTIDFNGSTAQQISGSSATSFYEVELDNAAGLTLAPGSGITTTIRHALTFTNGCITLGNYNLDFELDQDGSSGLYGSYGSSNFIVTNGTGVFKRYNIGSSNRTTAIFPIGISSGSYTPVTLAVASTTTNDNFSARVSQTVYAYATSGAPYTTNVVDRTWDISEGTNGGSNVTLTFQWPASIELTSFSRSNCFVGHFKSGKWAKESGTGAAGGSNPYTRTTNTVSTFSPFSIGSGGALPIELLTFEVKPAGNTVLASWTTASEINNDYFTLERSKDAINFEKLISLPGAGNSDHLLNYSEADHDPLPGVSYYRLKQTDYDGKSSYSQIQSVEFNSTGKVAVYYNSNNLDQTSLSYLLEANSLVSIEIVDALGRLVAIPVQEGYQETGMHNYVLEFQGNAGVYFARVKINGKLSVCKFIH